VSTAFANCNEKFITEEVIDPPMSPERAIEAVDFLDDDNFNKLTQQIISPRPNSYIYTKAIAESLVLKESANIRCVIVRPSIVGATWLEPFPGWIDNFNGPTGLFQAFNMGILRCMVGKREVNVDIIPVDVCIHMIIAAAWYTGSKKINKLQVYNCTLNNEDRMTWGTIEDYSNYASAKYPSPSSNLLLTPSFKFTTHT
jgi:fatty acyl-CoA reductase